MSLLSGIEGPDEARFDGSDYDPELDDPRLRTQLDKVEAVMRDGKWRTIKEIQDATGIVLDGSVSKHLRHLRYERFGSYPVDKRRRGAAESGVWEYRVGEKGTGEPVHKTSSVAVAAFQAADDLIPYLEHKPACPARRSADPCKCGFVEARKAWAEARGATRG